MINVPIDEIIVGERFRKEYKDIPSLAESIKQHGLLQPIVIADDKRLIAGGRRLEACKHAGLSTIPAVFRSEVDELTLRELELEENIQRDNLTWLEQSNLTAEIDRLKRLKYGDGSSNLNQTTENEGWTVYDTAEAINKSTGTVSLDLTAARVVEMVPELADEPDRNAAISKFDKWLEKLEREWAVRTGDLKDDNVYNGDCLDVLKTLPAASVDLVLLDPPYGTDVDSLNQGVTHTDTHFDDSTLSAIKLLKKMLPELARVLKPNGHIYCFAGLKAFDTGIDGIKQPLYAMFATMFEKAGFSPDYIPLAWIKNTAGLVEFDYRYAFAWEPILFISYKEMRSFPKRRTNVFEFASATNKVNLAQKPDDLYAELIQMSTQPGEVVLDPTAGSGRSVVVAKNLGRRYIAIEKDRNQYNEILRALGEENP